MRFPTMWYERPAKPRISLCIRAVWSEPLQVAWVFCDCWATDWTPFGVAKLNKRLQRLVWVYTCQNATLLEISCTGSYNLRHNKLQKTNVTHCRIVNLNVPARSMKGSLMLFEDPNMTSTEEIYNHKSRNDYRRHTQYVIESMFVSISTVGWNQ